MRQRLDWKAYLTYNQYTGETTANIPVSETALNYEKNLTRN